MNTKELNYKKSWLRILHIILIILAIGWSAFPNILWLVIFPYGLIPLFAVVFATYILNVIFFKLAKNIYIKNKVNLAYLITISSSLLYAFVNLGACVWIEKTFPIH